MMRFAVVLFLATLDGSASAQEKKSEPDALPKLGEKFQSRDFDLTKPIYANSFDSPDALKGWRLEGGKRMSVANGNLVLESDPSKKGKDEKSIDHLVCWLEKDLP